MASPAGDSGERGKEFTDRSRLQRTADRCDRYGKPLSASSEAESGCWWISSDSLRRPAADVKRPEEG